MGFRLIKIQGFRNLKHCILTVNPIFNFIIGSNGSGKSSVLEALYLLTYGRSFRTSHSDHLINYESTGFSVYTEYEWSNSQLSLAVEKFIRNRPKYKIANEKVDNVIETAKIVPLKFINTNSQQLFTGPVTKREFLDWGLFHSEPQFFLLWQRFKRTLKQRNATLAQPCFSAIKSVWDQEFIELGNQLDTYRKTYVQLLKKNFLAIKEKLLTGMIIELDYYSGWDMTQSLEQSLVNTLKKDQIYGYTTVGPHRANLLIKIRGVDVEEILSRGEQKLLAYSLHLTQGQILRHQVGKQVVYLLDDITAELDQESFKKVIQLLTQLESQVFLTLVDDKKLAVKDVLPSGSVSTFHMEQGKFHATDCNL